MLWQILTVFISGFALGRISGFNAGRYHLKGYLIREVFEESFPKECLQCPKRQEYLKKLDPEQITVPISEELFK